MLQNAAVEPVVAGDFRERLIERARAGAPVTAAIVADSRDPRALHPLLAAEELGIITPVFFGSASGIRAMAASRSRDVARCRVVDAPTEEAALVGAEDLVHVGGAEILVRGFGDEAPATGLRDRYSGRRLSHVFVLERPGRSGPLLVTDAEINIDPDLETKADIVRNAIKLHQDLGLGEPRVAILSAASRVAPGRRADLDAAALCKMRDRGQLMNGFVEGPLALDHALDPLAALADDARSRLGGEAQILVAPNREEGLTLVDCARLLAGARGVGIVLGAEAPIVFFGRSDDEATRIASCALAAVLVARHRVGRGSAG